MSIFGSSPIPPNPAQTLAGMQSADRVTRANADAQKAAKDQTRKRAADAVEIDVQTAQSTDAVKDPSRNGDEETNEERQEQDHYDPHNSPAKPKIKHLDVQG